MTATCGERSTEAARASRTSRARASASWASPAVRNLSATWRPEPGVLGQEHLAHAAAAEAFDDAVLQQLRSRDRRRGGHPLILQCDRLAAVPVLSRRLGLWSAIGVAIGITIGGGIYRTPAVIATRVPDASVDAARVGASAG